MILGIIYIFTILNLSVLEWLGSLLTLVFFYVLQEDFVSFLRRFLLCLFLGILYLLLLLEDLHLPHYIVFIIVGVYYFYNIVCNFLSSYWLSFNFFLVDKHRIFRSTQESFLLLCLWWLSCFIGSALLLGAPYAQPFSLHS